MAFSLKDIWEQSDFWDKEENAKQKQAAQTRRSTVQKQPAKTVTKPKQNLWDKTRDVFDANSSMDIYKRNQRGIPSLYQDAERLKGVGDRSINTNPLQRAVTFGRATADGITLAPRTIGRAVGNTAATFSDDYKNAQQSENRLRDIEQQTDRTMFKLYNSGTPEQRQRAANYLNKSTPAQTGMNDLNAKIASENDPRRLVAAGGSLALDLATLGVASTSKAAIQGAYRGSRAAGGGVTTGLVAGGKQFATDTAKTASMGAGSGFSSTYAENPNATLNQAVTGAGVGAAMGAALPAGFVAASTAAPVIAKATTKLVSNTGKATGKAIQSGKQGLLGQLDSLNKNLTDQKIAYDREPNPTVKARIGQGIANANKEIAKVSKAIADWDKKQGQGGFVANPFYKDPVTGKEVLRKGVKEKQIFTGPEGKPQFEVSDRDMKVKDILKHRGRAPIETKLSDVIEHKKMFETYPVLADMPVTLRNLEKSNGGGYNRASKRIVINKNWPMAKKEKVILHEAQHAIQHIEDFQRGGGYSKVANISQDRINTMPSNSLYNAAQARSINNTIQSTLLEIRKEFGTFAIKDKKIIGVTNPKAKPLIDKFNNLVKEFELETSKPHRAQIQHQAYEDIMGENVARTVTNRRMMTDAERAAKPFYQNMDADPKNAIMVNAKEEYLPIDKNELNRIMKTDTGAKNAVRQPNRTSGTRKSIEKNSPTKETQKTVQEETPKPTERNSTVATLAPPVAKPVKKVVIQPRQISETATVTKTGEQGLLPPKKPPVDNTPPQLGAGKQKHY
jgi:hypothetical protein